MKTIRQKNIGIRVMSFVVAAALALSLLPEIASAAEENPTKAPNANYSVVYYYDDMTPTLYMWNLADAAKGALYRVYDSNLPTAKMIGSAHKQDAGSCCIIPLELTASGSGSVYVTCQEDGKAESERVQVPYTKAPSKPGVSFEVHALTSAAQSGGLVAADSKENRTERNPSWLTQDRYYAVDVIVNNFTKIQTLSIPIKYNPEFLQLTKLTPATVGGSTGYRLNGAVSTAAEGDYLTQFVVPTPAFTNKNLLYGNFNYGIGIYPDLCTWGAKQSVPSSTSGNEWLQTPYVNTNTGLIKLELSSENVVDINAMEKSNMSGATTSNAASIRILRLYFKCLKKPTETAVWGEANTLHIATSADIPEGVTSASEAMRYCNTVTPGGIKASIQAIDLLAAPLAVDTTGDIYTSNRAVLSASQIDNLPKSLSTADQIRALIEGHVKVYNYTNYGDGTEYGSYNTLDTDLYPDVLILTPSSGVGGAAKQGDKITVYGPDSSVPIAGPTAVDNEGGVILKLGTANLSPDGGSVYVTVTRNGTESARIEVPYSAEMTRNVRFRVNSSGYTGADNSPMSENFSVKSGDQIRLDIYFNNFDDLLAYTFDMSFDSKVVQAADSTFHVLARDGYISEKNLKRKDSALEVGADLSEVTFNEQIAYETWNSYQDGSINQDEVLEIIASLGIKDLAELYQIAQDVEVKNNIGGESWKGGLYFSGPAKPADGDSPGRTEDEVYPYASNSKGRLRFSSAVMAHPPVVLQKTGDGYHFLSVYFVATASGEPNFEIYGARDVRVNGTQIVDSRHGSENGYERCTEIVLAGPGNDTTSSSSTVCTVPFTADWSLYGMEAIEKNAIFNLADGNATNDDIKADNDYSAMYLYNGYSFRDPGFMLRGANDEVLADTEAGLGNTEVKRYYTDSGGVRHELGQWSANEEITDFVIPDGEYSATYDLVYEYTDVKGKLITATRKIYVISKRGDLNGDGVINLFDEQFSLDGNANTSDTLYNSKTFVDQEVLHNHLMGKTSIEQEYTMPIEIAPAPLGNGSDRDDAFRMWLEFYPANASPDSNPTPLNPANLPAGREVIAVLRYENLSSLGAAASTDGLINFGVSFDYDPAYFTPNGFEDNTAGDTVFWLDEAKSLNESWITVTSMLASTAESDASDKAEENGRRRVYLQYISSMGEGLSIFDEEEGYLGAFSFKVADTEFTDVGFGWLDYALSTTDTTTSITYNQNELLDGVTNFRKPEDVTTASVKQTGYTISGEVVSYNAKNPIYYELYKMGSDGQYETTAAYTGTAVEASAQLPSGRLTQTFTIEGIGDGTYKLVLNKNVHLSYTIRNLVVSGADVDLTAESYASEIRTMTMAAGDVDGNGAINSNDLGIVTNTANYNRVDAATARNPEADIDGNGAINSADKGIITSLQHYNKMERQYDFVIS